MKKYLPIAILCLLTWWTAVPAAAEVFTVDNNLSYQHPTDHLYYLEDPTGKLTIETLPAQETEPSEKNKFIAHSGKKINFGFTQSVYWVRFKTYNPTGEPVDWYLKLFGNCDHITFYKPGAEGIEKMEAGWTVESERQPLDTLGYKFPVTQSPGHQTYYLRLESDSPIFIHPLILSPRKLKRYEALAFSAIWIFLGIIIALAVYNLFIYLTVRERSYLCLVFFILSYSALLYYEMGFFKLYFHLTFPLLPLTLSFLAFGFLMQFTRTFLNTETHVPRLDRILRYWIMSFVLFFGIVLTLGDYYGSQLLTAVAIATLAILLLTGVICKLNNVRSARYYLFSSTTFLVVLLLGLLDFFGISPTAASFLPASLFGFILMIFLFSLGITNKISTMRSERIKALEARQESEQRLSSIFENASEGIFQLSPDLEVLTVNPAMAEIFGYESLEGLKSCTHFQERFDTEVPQKIRNEIKRSGFIKGLEARAFRMDGRPIYVSINAHAVKDDKGNLLFLEGFMRDITERKHGEKLLRMAKEELELRVKERTAELTDSNTNLMTQIAERERAESALKQSEERHRRLIETLNEGFAILDIKGHLTYVNPRLCEMFGFSEEEAVGRSIMEFTDSTNQKILARQWESRLDSKKPPYEVTWTRKDGSLITTLVSPQPIFDADGNYMGSSTVLTDITSMKEFESQLKQARDLAENANRAKSEFLANMSHEIRTPLNAVLGFTDLLSGMITDPRQRSHLNSIKSSGKNLLMLINDILDLSKIEAGKMELSYEAVNPYVVFKELKQVFSMRIEEKGLDFIIDIAPEIPESLLLDEVRLRQILFNLVGNAVKFTEQGHVKLSVKNIYTREDHSTLDLIVAVEDTGIGISPESQRTIFDAFKQQDGQSTKKYGGTGLGLAITRRLVQMMEGEITLKSEVGKGSRFELVFRDVAVASTFGADNEEEDDAPHRDLVFDTAVVLVVDDVEPNRVLVREFLMQKGLEVLEAEDGKKAIQMAHLYKPDHILMDIRMPVMDGRTALKKIKSEPSIAMIPVIALTASAMKGDRERMLKDGFDGFLHKPVQAGDLFHELSIYLKYRRLNGDSEKKNTREYKTIQDDSRFSRFSDIGAETTQIKLILEKVENEPVSDEAVNNIPKVMELLENQFKERWETVRKNGFFNDIKNFGEDLKKMGQENDSPLVREYADALIQHVENFDVENMNVVLKGYSRLIEQLISTNPQKNKKNTDTYE